MALRITSASTPIRVERLNLCIYGPPGVGKTTLAFTADAPLLLDFDRGSYRAGNRKDVVQVERWGDIAGVTQADLAPYKTVIVDTAGRALDCLTAEVIRRDAKMGQGGGQLTQKGFGALKYAFQQWLASLNGFGLDVVLIAHMDEQRKGDEVLERLDVTGSSKGEIYKTSDAMGRIAIRDRARVLSFDPTDAAFGKNPGQLEALTLPAADLMDGFLGGVIAQIKAKLNALTEEQRVAQAQVAEWRTRIAGFVGADDFNAHAAAAQAVPEGIRKAVEVLYFDAAQARSVAWDGKAKHFVDVVRDHGAAQGDAA